MTEEEWLQCADAMALLEFVRERVTARKLRLLGCAFVRWLWADLGEKPPLAVDTAEKFADGLVTKAALRRCRQEVRKERHALEAAEAGMRPGWLAYWLTEMVASENAYGSVLDEFCDYYFDIVVLEVSEWIPLCNLVRDVVGHPFHPITLDPSWRTPTVTGLAEGIYDERRFEDLPILGDALEEAGCADATVLEHARGSTLHVRGCWLLDLLLRKE